MQGNTFRYLAVFLRNTCLQRYNPHHGALYVYPCVHHKLRVGASRRNVGSPTHTISVGTNSFWATLGQCNIGSTDLLRS